MRPSSLTPSERKALVMVGDFLLLWLALGLSYLIWALKGGNPFSWKFVLERKAWMVLPPLWFVLAAAGGLYDYRNLISLRNTLRGAVACGAVVSLGYAGFYFFFSPHLSLPRGVVVYHSILSISLVGGWRYMLLLLHNNPLLRRRCILIGKDEDLRDAISFLSSYPFFEIVGSSSSGCNLKLFEATAPIEEVILTPSALSDPSLTNSLLPLAEKGISITPLPHLYEELTGRVPIEHISAVWWYFLSAGGKEAGGFYPLVKRITDVFGAILGLAFLGMLLPFVAVAIKLTSAGPVFYRQKRVGKGGRIFTIVKLRTMRQDAERGGAVWAARNDPRVTFIGRLLRKMRLDEFPQCWNILKGEMSIIGPRPERPEFVGELRKKIPLFELRHSVKPGMAGWAMVNHGYVATVEDAKIRLEYDLYYIKHQSLWFDAAIFLRALVQLLLLRGR